MSIKIDKKQFTADTMKRICYVTRPLLSEDGKTAIYVSHRGREEDGAFPSEIHLIRIGEKQESEDLCLTPEGHCEKQPLLSRDGRKLWYLSDESGEFQLYEKRIDTDDEKSLTASGRKLTSLRHGLNRYSISLDESKAAFEAVLWPDEYGSKAYLEMSPEEKKEWEEELDYTPYVAGDLMYKMDEWHGMRKGEMNRIGVLDLKSEEQCLIDTGKMEAEYPALSADGSRIAFFGYPYGGPKQRSCELFVKDADGSIRMLTKDNDCAGGEFPVFTADESGIVVTVYKGFREEEGSGMSILPWIADAKGKEGDGCFAMDPEDEAVCHGVYPIPAGRLEIGDKNPAIRISGDTMYFLTGKDGHTRICSVKLDPSSMLQASKKGQPVLYAPVRTELEGADDVQGFYRNEKGDLAALMSTFEKPAELFVNGRQLTDCNGWLSEYALASCEEHRVTSRDGQVLLQYYLVKPADWDEEKCYPAVLDIKGGPTTMYSLAFWHEFQALAGAGMAVVFGNPRGSLGFGHAFCKNDISWKPEAMNDLLDMLEDAGNFIKIDKNRLGVTGGSYGGFMTIKLIGRTKVFAAAAAQRCLANTATSYGTGDIGFVSAGELPKNFRMFSYLKDRAKGNNISYIDRIKTPLLILHAYQDYRCGFEQAEQVFIPMKERNPEVPVRLVMFPNENHGMTRTGKLYHQVQHLAELVNWFVRFLIIEPGKQTETFTSPDSCRAQKDAAGSEEGSAKETGAQAACGQAEEVKKEGEDHE